MTNLLKAFGSCERGAVAVEYALITSLIGVAIILPVSEVSERLKMAYSDIATALQQRR